MSAAGLFLVLSLLAGCGRDLSHVPYDRLPADAVLVSVDGRSYTKGELDRDQGIRMDLLSLSCERLSDGEREAVGREFRATVLENFIARELLLAEAARRKLEITAPEVRAFEDRFAAGLSSRVRVGFPAVLSVLGKRASAFHESIRKDALVSLLRARFRKEQAARLMPSRQETLAALEKARRHNAAAGQANAKLGSLMTNAWRSIVSGNDFDAVGRHLLKRQKRQARYSSDWEAPAGLAVPAGKGEVSPPFLVDGALTILRPSAASSSSNRFSCIQMELVPVYEIESVENAQATMLRIRTDEAMETWIAALRKAARVKFPCGDDVLGR